MDKSNQTLKLFTHHHHFDELESTMDKAQELSKDIQNGLIVTTSKQINGRGRNGKNYISNNNDGIWCTLGLTIKNDIAFNYIKRFSVALCRYLQVEHDIQAKIKWPNDIFFQNKKLCGLLAELSSDQKILLLGFGLNVNQELFEHPIDQVATSCYLINNRKINNFELMLKEILLSFESALKLDEEIINELYKEHSLIWNVDAYLDNELVHVFGVQNDGTISIRKKGKQQTVSAGDLRPKA